MQISNFKSRIANRLRATGRGRLRATGGLRAFLFVVVSMSIVIAPMTLWAASGGPAKPFHYEDERLGEHKDESDKFKFVRMKIAPMYPGAFLGDRGEPWSHDYPEAGLHFSKILSELSKLPVVLDENEWIFSFADPNLMKYPFAYMCEVGYMQLTDEEIAGMREYLLRGGFLLVDDFRSAGQMRNFEYYVKRAFPEAEYQMKPLDITHPIFNCFFSIKTLDVRPPYDRGKPVFLGFEDKHGRLMMIINYNNDVSDYWQWSGDPYQPLPAEDTQGAYKFGVNYVFYALTH